MLTFSAVLGLAQLFAAAGGSTMQRGTKWNFSPRDQKVSELTGVAGRLDRAFKNFLETFGFFVAAVLVVVFANSGTSTSALGAQIYLFARLVYLGIYVAGIPV